MKFISLVAVANCVLFIFFMLLGIKINVFLAALLTIILPIVLNCSLLCFVKRKITNSNILIISIIIEICYSIYSIYIMNLPGYDNYIKNASYNNGDFQVDVDPNMLSVSQIIFNFLVYFIILLIAKIIINKWRFKNARI